VGAVTGATKLAGGVGQHLDWGRRQSLGDGTCGHVHGTHAPAGEHHSQAYSDFVCERMNDECNAISCMQDKAKPLRVEIEM
jgi:hypothetical protein